MAVDYRFECRWDGVNWTNETAYLLDWLVKIGMPENDYFAAIAESGVGLFVLSNTSRRFSASNSSSAIYAYLRPSVQVRIYAVSGVNQTQLFYGFIRRYRSGGEQYGVRNIVFECMDLVEPLKWQRARITYAATKNVATAVSEIFAQAYGVPPGTSYDDNGDVISQYGKRGFDGEDTSVYAALRNVSRSFFGNVFVDRNGNLSYVSRAIYDNPGDGSGSPIITDSDLEPGTSFEDDVSYDRLINHVRVTCYPPETIAATTVIWRTTVIPVVQPSTTRNFSLAFRDPNTAVACAASTVISPVNGTDVIINSRSDGLGINLTGSSSITLTYTIEARRLVVQVVNNSGYPAYFTTLQVRGNPIVTYDPVMVEIDNSAGVLRRLFELDATMIGDTERAYMYCQYMLLRYTARHMVRSCILPGGINADWFSNYDQLGLFDVVRLSETQSGINAVMHYIRRIEYTPNAVKLFFDLVSTYNYFTTELSELNGPDILKI